MVICISTVNISVNIVGIYSESDRKVFYSSFILTVTGIEQAAIVIGFIGRIYISRLNIIFNRFFMLSHPEYKFPRPL